MKQTLLNAEQKARYKVALDLAIKLLVAADREDVPAFEDARADLTMLFAVIDLDVNATKQLSGEE